MLKQINPKRVSIGGVDYAIYPFSAFKAAGISGDLGRFIGPMVAGVLPLVKNDMDIDKLLGEDIDKLMPMISGALSSLESDKVEKMLMELLINERNISCEYRDEKGNVVQSQLTKELADELFIGGLDNMVKLAVEVVKLNYGNFFTGLAGQSGTPDGLFRKFASKTTEGSTDVVSII